MMVSMAGFTLNDTCIKLLSGSLGLAQVVFLRGLLVSVLLYIVGRRLAAFSHRLSRRDLRIIAVRTLAELGATYFFLTALFHMPLPNVTAILQALPLSVALAAALVFKESLGWRRLSAIAVGFAGVMLIVQPGGEGFSVYALYALAAVGCVTMRDLAARRLSPEVPSVAVAFITATSITFVAGLILAFEMGEAGAGGKPLSEISWPETRLILGAALSVLAGYLASVMCMRVGEIGVVAPFRYTGLLWALVLGWAVFDYWPDGMELTGATIVVAMGLFTLYRESRLRRGAA
ncbi:DMT family transporter [Rhodobacteraceae bacterium 10Alg 79]|uniref:DMT family transporter n=2 Tax=Rhodalgimonas zhirmunskyi TaxID=2964767 RepID=A0AAJ1X8L1_9RHOB|nr:DMT family transporter [Rhodoalgimonas zhirmunskyi]